MSTWLLEVWISAAWCSQEPLFEEPRARHPRRQKPWCWYQFPPAGSGCWRVKIIKTFFFNFKVLSYLDSKLVSVILNSWLALRTDDAMNGIFSENCGDYQIGYVSFKSLGILLNKNNRNQFSFRHLLTSKCANATWRCRVTLNSYI